MLFNNRSLILLYRIILVVAAAAGLWYGLGLPYGYCDFNKFVYYTFLSNFLCLLYFITAAVYNAVCIKATGVRGDASPWPHLKGGLTVMIGITFLVYWLVLSPRIADPHYNPYAPDNLLLHYVTPLMVIGDWLLFDRKGIYKVYAPFLWLAGPVLYMLFIFIRAPLCGAIGATGSRYPYFFMNLDVLSLWRFGLYAIGLLLLFTVMGYILWGLDKLCAQKSRRRLPR